ncbi:MAG: hypothetical protein QOG09_1776 [Solirubrobacterales bacterium]|jgi:outer membrane protein assembly factor BamB|nr:hypothetical protein [Solirubrobacterales bacterium]
MPPPLDLLKRLLVWPQRALAWLDRRTEALLERLDRPFHEAVKGLDRRYDAAERWARRSRRRGLKWARSHQVASAAIGVVIAGLLVGLVGYAALRRPADVSHPNVFFNKKQRVKPNKRELASWPFYGHDEGRTKFLPGKGLDPPFKRVWRFEARKLLEFPPIYVRGRLYMMNNDGVFFALNAKTGNVKWRRKIGSLNASSPAYAGGRVYGVNLAPAQAFALNARTGKTIWRKPLPGRAESSPVVSHGRVYFGCECGSLYAVSARTGKTIWTASVAGAIKASPALYRGVLYVGDYGGQMSAIRASDGSSVWRTGSQGSSFGRSGEFYSTAAIAYGRVYVGNNDGRVYSFELRSGALAWSHSLGGYVYSGPAVADTAQTNPTVYVGSFDNRMHALDARTGNELWSVDGGGNVSGAISVIGNTAYVSNVDSTLTRGFDIRSHREVINFSTGAYTPMISDGRWLYLTGYSSIQALKPVRRHHHSKHKKLG